MATIDDLHISISKMPFDVLENHIKSIRASRRTNKKTKRISTKSKTISTKKPLSAKNLTPEQKQALLALLKEEGLV